MNIEPMIVVKNIPLARDFYQKALGLQAVHGGDEYEMLMANGKLVLQLHHHDAHEHPGLWEPNVRAGNGTVLWFRTKYFADAVSKIRKANANIVAEPHVNPNAKQHEFWFRDPDGYMVVVSDNPGDASQ